MIIRRNGRVLVVFFLVYHARVSSFGVVPIPRTTSLKTFRLSVASLVEEESASNREPVERRPHVVIVGGGVGGLAMAARLAVAAVQVTLLEKNAFTGGRCGSFAVELTDPQNDAAIRRFRHERGPSLLLLPHLYEQLYQDVAHTTVAAYGLTMRPCVPAYTVVFEDGDRISVGFPDSVMKNDDNDALQRCYQESRHIMNRWEEQGAEKWDDYLDICRSYLQCGLPNFIEERLDLSTLPSFIQAATRNGFQAWPLKPHSDVLDDLFQSDKMRALASFQDLYVGLEPYRNDRFPGGGVGHTTAPAVFGLLSAIELHPECGVFAPVGGFQSVQESLHRLAIDSGVKIQCNTTVVRVTGEGVYCHDTNDAEESESNAATHSSKFMPADMVVMNADLPYAQKSLFEEPGADAKYDWDDEHYRYSSGVIAFHWSMNRSLDELNTHTVFLCAANRTVAQQSWESVRSLNVTGTSFMTLGNDEPFNFYVHRASETDPTAAPKVRFQLRGWFQPFAPTNSLIVFGSLGREWTPSWYWFLVRRCNEMPPTPTCRERQPFPTTKVNNFRTQ
jgi:phytoene desaturase (3,4-didehydrolycopene-forming)